MKMLYVVISASLFLGCDTSRDNDDDAKTGSVHVENFPVNSVSNAARLESQSGVQYELRFGFDADSSGQPILEAEGYRLVPFLVVHTGSLQNPQLSSATLQFKATGNDRQATEFFYVQGKKSLDETNADDRIYLKSGGVSQEVGRFRDHAGDTDPYATYEHPIICEAEYTSICNISLQTRLDLDHTQSYDTGTGTRTVPQIEATLIVDGPGQLKLLSITNANF